MFLPSFFWWCSLQSTQKRHISIPITIIYTSPFFFYFLLSTTSCLCTFSLESPVTLFLPSLLPFPLLCSPKPLSIFFCVYIYTKTLLQLLHASYNIISFDMPRKKNAKKTIYSLSSHFPQLPFQLGKLSRIIQIIIIIIATATTSWFSPTTLHIFTICIPLLIIISYLTTSSIPLLSTHALQSATLYIIILISI